MKTSLGPPAQFTPGTIRQVEVGGANIVVFNVEGEFHACAAECPHRGANLGQGKLHGSTLVCPWHEWEFDARTGEGITNPLSGLKKYQLEVVDGELVLYTSNDPSQAID